MNSIVLILISLFVPYNVQCTSNWGSNASSNANDKQTISFYGTLTTHQGQAETVDQILIENKHNDIIMYNAPVKHEKANFNEKTKQTEIKLDANTVTNFIKSSIDLSKTSMIKVPEPTTIWVYQKRKKTPTPRVHSCRGNGKREHHTTRIPPRIQNKNLMQSDR